MNTKNIFFIFGLFAILLGCRSELPDSYLIGAADGVDISFHKTSSKDLRIEAVGIVPFNIKREQIRPTIFFVLKQLKIKYPDCKQSSIVLTPERDSNPLFHFISVGSAIYKDDQISIHYGIPSDDQISKYNADGEKSKPVFILGEWTPPFRRLYRPDMKTYELCKKIILKSKVIENNEKENGQISSAPVFLAKVARHFNLSKEDTEYYWTYLYKYYSFFPGTQQWGDEKVILK